VRATPSLFVAFVDAPFFVSRIFHPKLKLRATNILHLTAQVYFSSHAVLTSCEWTSEAEGCSDFKKMPRHILKKYAGAIIN